MRKRTLKKLLKQMIRADRANAEAAEALATSVERLTAVTPWRRKDKRPDLRYLGEKVGDAEFRAGRLWDATHRVNEIFKKRKKSGDDADAGGDADPGA